MPSLALSPDRLFPPDPTTRAIARRLHAEVADAPILSPHGHVDPRLLADDVPFPDPAALLVTPDHYVTRLLHAHGVGLDRLGLGRAGSAGPSTASARQVWAQLCTHWRDLAGTPVRSWLQTQLVELFGVDQVPSAATADALYDAVAARLAEPAFRPRALFERFGLRVLATTDDPVDDLASHRALRDDPSFPGRVVPTLRADRFMDPSAPAWRTALDELSAVSGIDCGTREGMLAALRERRRHFAEHGATATDTGVVDAGSTPLPPAEAERLHQRGRAGTITAQEAVAYRHDTLFRFAQMSVDDGLVMQLHVGVARNHHRPTLAAFGPDTGHDLPLPTRFTEPLAPLLDAFGTAEGFHLVLFTVDETTFSREIGPLAGFYPCVYAGAPWWFLDTPAAIGRYRAAVTDAAGITKTSGFVDDTRAFCSIPTRHDMSRRVDAGWLADLVARHVLTEDDALDAARRLVHDVPVATFKLDQHVQGA